MIDEIISIIQSFGFPIAVCLVCFFYINKQAEQHKTEVTSLTEAIHEMRIVLQQLMDKFGG